MKPDDIQLLAYVDGELPPHERDEIDQVLRASPELEEQVASLRASQLPYREIFNQQKLPPLPDGLAKKIAAMAHESAQKNNEAAVGANDPVVPHDPRVTPAAPVRSRLRVAPAWLAVAFVGGALICGAVLHFAPGAVPGINDSLSVATNARPWVVAAANYQQLYTRATLEYVDADPALSKKTLDSIHTQDGIALAIPDLRQAGLTFKRVQRLRFGDRSLVQIVYLPDHGEPVALCVMKETSPNQTFSLQHIDGMSVVTWRQSELGYALIGRASDTDLATIAKRIADNRDKALFVNTARPAGIASSA